jgi:hypothetical protein
MTWGYNWVDGTIANSLPAGAVSSFINIAVIFREKFLQRKG